MKRCILLVVLCEYISDARNYECKIIIIIVVVMIMKMVTVKIDECSLLCVTLQCYTGATDL